MPYGAYIGAKSAIQGLKIPILGVLIPINQYLRMARPPNPRINSRIRNIKEGFYNAKKNESPYVSHVFVCTNDRGGERKSCADNNSQLIKSKLKEAVNEKGWKGKVRISTSGCMGLCAKGSNVMIYPQKVWFSEVSTDDVDEIVSTIEHIMANH